MQAQLLQEFKQKFWVLVGEAEKIVITSHLSPDEDSVASVLAVYELIKTKWPSKALRIIYTGEPVARFSSFKNFERVEFVPELAEELGGVDLLIGLDASQYYRFSHAPERVAAVPTKICLDHHGSPPDKFELSLIDANSPACAELIYRALAEGKALTKELAEIFLLGILGDTGNFAYLQPQQAETFAIARRLVEASGTNIQTFQSRYRSISPRAFALIQELMRNAVISEQGFHYTLVSREFVESGAYNNAEVSEASHIYIGNYLLRVAGASWGFVITPKADGNCGISVRSLPGSINARELLERLKLGGGHDRAAGGTFAATGTPLRPEECLEKILKAV